MLKKILNLFKSSPKEEENKTIEFSKIDKYMNLIMRDRLGEFNKTININVTKIEEEKREIILDLRHLHKKSLLNPDIPQREIQIMDGNRENYIKRVSHFITRIELPKNYIELYDYCLKFADQIGTLGKEIQKNIFVLKFFFDNELQAVNKRLTTIEKSIIEIKIMFDKNNINLLKETQDNINIINTNNKKILDIKTQIIEEEITKKQYIEKIKRSTEKISTIITGTDYRALESFKTEKQLIEDTYKKSFSEIEILFSEIETGLKKYFYRNQDKKIIRTYFDSLQEGLLNDEKLEFANIVQDIIKGIEEDSIDLKDKKKDTTIAALNNLNFEFLKNKQAELKKLLDTKQGIQTKITHNSASLNLSEQQYWIKNNEEKVAMHNDKIEKLNKEIDKIKEKNSELIEKIEEKLEKLNGEKVKITDEEGILEK